MTKYEKIEPLVSGYLKTKLSKELTNSLKNICLEINKTPDDWDAYDFYMLNYPEIKEFNDIQVDMVKEYMKTYSSVRTSENFSFKGWANIRKGNSWHPPHCHNDIPLIFNTYVGVPENTYVSFMNPERVYSAKERGVGTGDLGHRIKPEEGTMILTPGWWVHWTEPTFNNDNRISISTNVTIH